MSKPARLSCLLLTLFLLPCAARAEPPAPIPIANTAIPHNFGVNTHIEDDDPSPHIALLRKAGFGWIRQDLDWSNVEKKPGIYHFEFYDQLFDKLSAAHIRIMAIVDYDNPNYDRGLSPYTDEGRKAFGRFAEAAAKRYADKKIVWEIYNEPNIEAWRPHPDVDAYLKLAEELTAALKRGDPNAVVVGPALNGPWSSAGDNLKGNFRFYPYLKRVLNSPVVREWSAITLHPYRKPSEPPESAMKQLEAVQRMLKERNLAIPVIAGEWGYSTYTDGITEEVQAAYAVRQLLLANIQGMPFSILYDWQDDGADQADKEHRFGILRFGGSGRRLDKKPAFEAIQKISETLNGYRFEKLEPSPSSVIAARFVKKDAPDAFVFWSVDNRSRSISLPVKGGGKITAGMMPMAIFAQ